MVVMVEITISFYLDIYQI